MDNIHRKARVWIVTLAADGKLVAELDQKRVERIKLTA